MIYWRYDMGIIVEYRVCGDYYIVNEVLAKGEIVVD